MAQNNEEPLYMIFMHGGPFAPRFFPVVGKDRQTAKAFTPQEVRHKLSHMKEVDHVYVLPYVEGTRGAHAEVYVQIRAVTLPLEDTDAQGT